MNKKTKVGLFLLFLFLLFCGNNGETAKIEDPSSKQNVDTSQVSISNNESDSSSNKNIENEHQWSK